MGCSLIVRGIPEGHMLGDISLIWEIPVYRGGSPPGSPLPHTPLTPILTFPLGKGEGTGSLLPLGEGPGVRA
jgi:hypothetical protein